MIDWLFVDWLLFLVRVALFAACCVLFGFCCGCCLVLFVAVVGCSLCVLFVVCGVLCSVCSLLVVDCCVCCVGCWLLAVV